MITPVNTFYYDCPLCVEIRDSHDRDLKVREIAMIQFYVLSALFAAASMSVLPLESAPFAAFALAAASLLSTVKVQKLFKDVPKKPLLPCVFCTPEENEFKVRISVPKSTPKIEPKQSQETLGLHKKALTLFKQSSLPSSDCCSDCRSYYESSNGLHFRGICFSVTLLWTRAVLLEKVEETKFNIRLKAIALHENRHLVGAMNRCAEFRFSERQPPIVDLKAFSENSLLLQAPFHPYYKHYLFKKDFMTQGAEEATELVSPVLFEERGQTIINRSLWILTGNIHVVTEYFEGLKDILAQRSPSDPRVVIGISLRKHIISFYYDHQADALCVFDINTTIPEANWITSLIQPDDLASFIGLFYAAEKSEKDQIEGLKIDESWIHRLEIEVSSLFPFKELEEAIYELGEEFLCTRSQNDPESQIAFNAMVFNSAFRGREVQLKRLAKVNNGSLPNVTISWFSGKEVEITKSAVAHMTNHKHLADLIPLFRLTKEDVEKCDSSNKWSLLHLAAAQGCLQLAELVLKAGGKIDAVDSDGNTPLHLACENEHHAILHFLVKMGANSNIKNNNDKIAAEVIESDKDESSETSDS